MTANAEIKEIAPFPILQFKNNNNNNNNSLVIVLIELGLRSYPRNSISSMETILSANSVNRVGIETSAALVGQNTRKLNCQWPYSPIHRPDP